MWTENARTVLEKRYLMKDERGAASESPEQLFERVAKSVAAVEKSRSKAWAQRFLDIMLARRFMPNSPTLMNAGKEAGQLSACFVLPVEDSLDDIFGTLRDAAKIHQSGGGTGFSFSKLRPEGSRVRSTQGVASGPVSFMRIYDTATETIKQGGARRGANMGILRVDHPDIVSFIESKLDQKSIINFNISVGITDAFMRAVETGSLFPLRDPKDGKVVRQVHAKDLLAKMVDSAWQCGDPGLVFLDRINRFNPTPQVGAMESTNPCGEQPLLPYESCNLGSLNLGMYVDRGAFDWRLFSDDIELCVRFLDDVIDANVFPVKECARITHRNRKIGLGVMGFADALLELGLPYDSESAFEFGERVMSFLDRRGKQASAKLAQEKGAFPNFKGSLWDRLGYPRLRNATVSTVAPTGTISIIAGASSGIEPVFSGVFYRNVLSGARLVEVHPAVERAFRERGESLDDLTDGRIAKVLGPVWRPAQAVPVRAHVRMQAVFQRHSDSAVSKTINLPEAASREDISEAYLEAYRQGCKGITVYRDRSRATQVLERPKPAGPVLGPDEGLGGVCPSC